MWEIQAVTRFFESVYSIHMVLREVRCSLHHYSKIGKRIERYELTSLCPQGELYSAKGRDENCELFFFSWFEWKAQCVWKTVAHICSSTRKKSQQVHIQLIACFTNSRNNCNIPGCAIIFAVPQVHFDPLQEIKLIPQASKLTGKVSVKLTSL